jgi:hypothetical protein
MGARPRPPRRGRALLLAGVLGACVPVPRLAAPAPQPRFDPLAFFAGNLEGQATLRIAFRSPVAVRVHSSGRVGPDGALLLDQRVEQAGKPARVRHWRVREVTPGRYAGTLSDADGPVSGETTGNRLHLRFPSNGGQAEQWLTLAPDGRSADNLLIVRRFGVTIAALTERIEHRGPGTGR